MTQGSGVDAREERTARKNKLKDKERAKETKPQEPDFDPDTMRYGSDVKVNPDAALKNMIASPKDFGSAFADARARLGAGQQFEWDGKPYTTDYAEEVGGGGKSQTDKFGNDATERKVGRGEPRLDPYNMPTKMAGPEPAPSGGVGMGNAQYRNTDSDMMAWLMAALGLGGAGAAAAMVNRPPRVPTQGSPVSQGMNPYAGRTPIEPNVPDFRDKFFNAPDEAMPVPPVNEPTDPNANWFDRELNKMDYTNDPAQPMRPGDVGQPDLNSMQLRPQERKIVEGALRGDPEAIKRIGGIQMRPEVRAALKAAMSAM